MGRWSKFVLWGLLILGASGSLGGCGCGCGCGCGEDPVQKGYSDEDIKKAQDRVKQLEEKRPPPPKAPEENSEQGQTPQ